MIWIAGAMVIVGGMILWFLHFHFALWTEMLGAILERRDRDPSQLTQGITLVLARLAQRLEDPVKVAKEELAEAPPMPIPLQHWINQESEPWARAELKARAEQLYREHGTWDSVGAQLSRETGFTLSRK